MAIVPSVEQFLKSNGVDYQVVQHPLAFTAQEDAALTHVPGREWAKTVVCLADGEPIQAVLPAHLAIDVEGGAQFGDRGQDVIGQLDLLDQLLRTDDPVGELGLGIGEPCGEGSRVCFVGEPPPDDLGPRGRVPRSPDVDRQPEPVKQLRS